MVQFLIIQHLLWMGRVVNVTISVLHNNFLSTVTFSWVWKLSKIQIFHFFKQFLIIWCKFWPKIRIQDEKLAHFIYIEKCSNFENELIVIIFTIFWPNYRISKSQKMSIFAKFSQKIFIFWYFWVQIRNQNPKFYKKY